MSTEFVLIFKDDKIPGLCFQPSVCLVVSVTGASTPSHTNEMESKKEKR
jgi:hypothetical protein